MRNQQDQITEGQPDRNITLIQKHYETTKYDMLSICNFVVADAVVCNSLPANFCSSQTFASGLKSAALSASEGKLFCAVEMDSLLFLS